MRRKDWGLLLARLLVGGVFVFAGTVKVVDPERFAGQIAAYELFPYTVNILVAATLPHVELLAGVLLLINRKVRAASLVVLFLTLVFLAVLGWAWAQGLQIDCGCFRPGAATSPREAFFRDLALLALAAWIWVRYERPAVAAD